MRITKQIIELKVKRLATFLKREGYDLSLSCYNPGGGRNLYQLNWKNRENGGEIHLSYNAHISGQELYLFMEGIEVGYDQAHLTKSCR